MSWKLFNKYLVVVLALFAFSACAELKNAGRAIGHGTRDAAKAIGHGTRDAVKAIGHGTRDAVKSVGNGAKKTPRNEEDDGAK